MAEDDIPTNIPPPNNTCLPPPKAIGVPCNFISGHMKMTMFHPSQPNTMLVYCEDVLDHMLNYGFVENIASGTMGTIHFMYDGPGPRRDHYVFPAAVCNGFSLTPKLPRLKIDGLHPYTYKSFLDALNYYLQRQQPREIFMLRFVPVSREDETDGRRWNIAELYGMTFVYVKNSLDIEDYNRYHHHQDQDEEEP